MPNVVTYLREFNFASVVFRLFLSALFGGFLGVNRARKGRAAGFRTYVCVCVGATLAILLGEYEGSMLSTDWASIAAELGVKTDISRFGAQVINGIGFLGIGTVIITGRHEVRGLTTAVGLWTAACIGLSVGVGFYECVFLGAGLVFLCLLVLPYFEDIVIRQTTHMNVYVEFLSMDDIRAIIDTVKAEDATVREIEVVGRSNRAGLAFGAVFMLHLNQRGRHAQILGAVSELDCVNLIEEV